MLKTDCKHFDEYVNRGSGIYTDWCLLHDCTNCDNCKKYKKENKGNKMLKVCCRYDYSNITKSGTAECQTCFKQVDELFLTIDEKNNTFRVCKKCLEHKQSA